MLNLIHWLSRRLSPRSAQQVAGNRLANLRPPDEEWRARLEQWSRFGHMPLLWLVVPLLAGIGTAQVFAPPFGNAWAAFAGACLLGLCLLRVSGKQATAHTAAVPLLCLMSGLFLVFWSYADWRHGNMDSITGFHPREVEVLVAVERLFENSQTDPALHRGIARVRDAPALFQHLMDQRLYFSINSSVFAPEPLAGSRIYIRGHLHPLARTHADSAFGDYLKRLGCSLILSQGVLVETVRPPGLLKRWARAKNLEFQDALRLGADTARTRSLSNVAVAMLLGQRAALNPVQRDAFLQTGTMHFFAVSGLHVGVVALALAVGLSLLRFPAAVAAVAGLLLLLLYVQITGAAPSAVRAYLMTAFFWGSWAFQRKPSPISALLASMAVVLLWRPEQLFAAGFQLSYAVAGGILLYGLPLGAYLAARFEAFRDLPQSRMGKWRGKIRSGWRSFLLTCAVSLSATLSSALLIAEFFGIFTPGAVILNIILLPLASIAIVSGMLSVAVSLPGWHVGGMILNHAAWLVLWVMEMLVGAAERLPWLFWQIPKALPFTGAGGVLGMFAVQLFLARKGTLCGRDFVWVPLWVVACLLWTCLIGLYVR